MLLDYVSLNCSEKADNAVHSPLDGLAVSVHLHAGLGDGFSVYFGLELPDLQHSFWVYACFMIIFDFDPINLRHCLHSPVAACFLLCWKSLSDDLMTIRRRLLALGACGGSCCWALPLQRGVSHAAAVECAQTAAHSSHLVNKQSSIQRISLIFCARTRRNKQS